MVSDNYLFGIGGRGAHRFLPKFLAFLRLTKACREKYFWKSIRPTLVMCSNPQGVEISFLLGH